MPRGEQRAPQQPPARKQAAAVADRADRARPGSCRVRVKGCGPPHPPAVSPPPGGPGGRAQPAAAAPSSARSQAAPTHLPPLPPPPTHCSCCLLPSRPCRCDDPPAPPPRRNSRGSLTGGTTSIQARVMAAAAAVVPPALGAGTMQREQLLPAAAGQGVAMKVDGHRATVTLSKNGLRWAWGWCRRIRLLLPRPGVCQRSSDRFSTAALGSLPTQPAHTALCCCCTPCQLSTSLFVNCLSWSYESTRCCCIPSVHSESGELHGRPRRHRVVGGADRRSPYKPTAALVLLMLLRNALLPHTAQCLCTAGSAWLHASCTLCDTMIRPAHLFACCWAAVACCCLPINC